MLLSRTKHPAPVRAAGIAAPRTTGGLLQLAAGIFFGAGATKLAGMDYMVAPFVALGTDPWMRYLVAAAEIGGGVLLLLPALSGLGAVLLIPVMLGAVVVEITVSRRPPLPALLCLGLLALIAWGQREETRALLERWRRS